MFKRSKTTAVCIALCLTAALYNEPMKQACALRIHGEDVEEMAGACV
jgi:hypothetical protein